MIKLVLEDGCFVPLSEMDALSQWMRSSLRRISVESVTLMNDDDRVIMHSSSSSSSSSTCLCLCRTSTS